MIEKLIVCIDRLANYWIVHDVLKLEQFYAKCIFYLKRIWDADVSLYSQFLQTAGDLYFKYSIQLIVYCSNPAMEK